MHIKTEPVYTDRRRTSFNENDTQVNKMLQIMHLTREETQYQKVSLFGPPCIMYMLDLTGSFQAR